MLPKRTIDVLLALYEFEQIPDIYTEGPTDSFLLRRLPRGANVAVYDMEDLDFGSITLSSHRERVIYLSKQFQSKNIELCTCVIDKDLSGWTGEQIEAGNLMVTPYTCLTVTPLTRKRIHHAISSFIWTGVSEQAVDVILDAARAVFAFRVCRHKGDRSLSIPKKWSRSLSASRTKIQFDLDEFLKHIRDANAGKVVPTLEQVNTTIQEMAANDDRDVINIHDLDVLVSEFAKSIKSTASNDFVSSLCKYEFDIQQYLDCAFFKVLIQRSKGAP